MNDKIMAGGNLENIVSRLTGCRLCFAFSLRKQSAAQRRLRYCRAWPTCWRSFAGTSRQTSTQPRIHRQRAGEYFPGLCCFTGICLEFRRSCPGVCNYPLRRLSFKFGTFSPCPAPARFGLLEK